MASNGTSLVLAQVVRAVHARGAESQTDGQLLRLFLAGRDEVAFSTLVRRHGPMVMGVCRRILRNVADAEDASQATFLVLALKAASLGTRAILGDWLHGVARRTALNARRLSARRRAKEQSMSRTETLGEEVKDDWLPLLDEELGRLPENYRLPIVLCDLEGRTRREAAERLGWPEGTVAGRLARGRALLARGLTRQGGSLTAGSLVAVLSQQTASASMPALLVVSTVKAANLIAVGGPAAAAGVISPTVAALAEGVVKAMFLTKLKTAMAIVGLSCLLAIGYGAVPGHRPLAHPGDPVKQEEHAALFDLVDDQDATHVAVASGGWGDPRTWDKGGVPGAGARVVIPKGRSVVVAGTYVKDRVDWVRVDGTLRFDPKTNTGLKVVTLVGNTMSTIEIGTEKERIQSGKVARLILGDRGERNKASRQRDPYDLSGGLLAHGKVRIFGAEYTSHAMPRAIPKKGDTEVKFVKAPRGWKPGDKLLFPGLDPIEQKVHEDEERVIRAVSEDGRTVTLNQALAFSHGGIFGYARAVPVGNLSRNVVIESENASEVGRRGHVMFMHTQDVVIDSALFRELGRTNVEGTLTNPEMKAGKQVPGTDANSIGRYAVHFHLRWGATYKQQPFIVRNSAVDGSPKLGIVNHGGYGLVDDNVSYRVRGSHFFTENGSEIGRFKGNLAVRSNGTDGDDDGVPIPKGKGYAGHPLNIGHGGHGFWLQGGGVDVTDNVAIGHTYSAFGFFVANNKIISYGGPQEKSNPLTRGTPWEKYDVFLTENLKDQSLAHGQRWLLSSSVPFHMARCVGLACRMGLRTRGIDRTELAVVHDKQDLVEECRFVGNQQGYILGYSPGTITLRNTQFIGSDPGKGGYAVRFGIGIGDGNHIPGYLRLENVTIDGYWTGCSLPARGVHVIKGGFINGIRKLVVACPWGGKLTVEDVKFGTMKPEDVKYGGTTKGEGLKPILFGADPHGPWLYGVPPYSNWTRKLQPFEFVYNGRQVYHDDQKAGAVPFDTKDRRWADRSYGTLDHGPLNGKTSQQLWDQYRLAIGGRMAPADLTPCPDILGGSFGPKVSFDPPVESEPSTGYYGGQRYERMFGKSKPDAVSLHPRYLYDPVHVHTPAKGFVAKVSIDGRQYQSEPTDLVAGVNVVPVKVGKLTRHVVVGSPGTVQPYKKKSGSAK